MTLRRTDAGRILVWRWRGVLRHIHVALWVGATEHTVGAVLAWQAGREGAPGEWRHRKLRLA